MEIRLHDEADKFLKSLNASEIAKTTRTIGLLERFGSDLGMPHSRHMGNGLLELRVRGKRELRLLYCYHGRSAVLLHAFIKKSEKTLSKELDTARARKDTLV